MSDIYAGIVCIAKWEQDYIEEFVKYHLALGFKYIYLYDNEDEPTYHKILEKYKEYITFFHLPGNDFEVGIQYIALHHFTENILQQSKLTHVIHIDIDEFILLKKHKNINEFIEEYIKDDCEGIGINWCFFGSSGHTIQTNEPITQRFTRCANEGNNHIKTLYRKDNIICYGTCHDVRLKSGYIKNTNGTIIPYALSPNIATDVIQINHYKTKTYEEFKKISKRGRADKSKDENISLKIKDDEYIDNQYELFNRNEIEDLRAKEFYKEKVLNMNNEIYPIIVCVAKTEKDYIEEFVKYHLALGFKYIYLYDNENEATYDKILAKYTNNVTILHTPNNNYISGIKYMILEHFKNNILYQDNKITHIINIDIDEFIVLKKHETISDFIKDYIKDDCEGIGINRVYFGSCGYKQKTDEPVTQRFIRCSNTADKRIKTLFKKDNFIDYGLCYNVKLRKGTIRNTKNEIIYGCNNITNIDLSIIQINKYKTKSYEEYMLMARRGKSSLNDIYNHYLGTKMDEIINNNFKIYDLNDKEDIIAKEYYKNNIINKIV